LSQEQAQHITSADQEETSTLVGGHEVAAHHGEDEEHIHLPGPSYWPILLAASIALTLIGLIISVTLAAIGLLLAFIFGIGWGMGWGLESRQEATVE
jgi:hypothetical protein